MPAISRKRLSKLSRDRSFLLQAGSIITIALVVVAFLIWVFGGRNFDPNQRVLVEASEDADIMLKVVRNPGHFLKDANDDWDFGTLAPDKEADVSDHIIYLWLKVQLTSSKLSEDELEVLENYAAFLYPSSQSSVDQGRERLKQLAEEGTQPLAAECYGDVRAFFDDTDGALLFYEQELTVRESQRCRDRILELLIAKGDVEGVRERIQDPEFASNASLYQRMRTQLWLRDYGEILKLVVLMNLQTEPVYFLLAVFVALIWFAIVGQMAGFQKGQISLYVVAVVLGMASTVATLYVVYLQEYIFEGVRETTELMGGIIYFVAGVGLREETIKLLFFVPLIPWLRKRGNDMEVLIAAGLVGLGFALQENISYYARSSGSAAVSRFLTANFFHLSLTGLIGFSFYRMVRYPKKMWEGFLTTFLLMVAAHGMYDALIVLPDLWEFGGIGSMIVLALVCYRFFWVADNLKWTGSTEISPLGILVIGLALLVGVSLNVVCFGMRPYPTYALFLLQCISLIPVAYIFINRFRDA